MCQMFMSEMSKPKLPFCSQWNYLLLYSITTFKQLFRVLNYIKNLDNIGLHCYLLQVLLLLLYNYIIKVITIILYNNGDDDYYYHHKYKIVVFIFFFL